MRPIIDASKRLRNTHNRVTARVLGRCQQAKRDGNPFDSCDRRNAARRFAHVSKPQNAQWLSTTEACERVGVTLPTLYRYINRGELVAYRFGRVIRIKTEDMERFIESSRIEPGTIGRPQRRAAS